ncbi:MAG TPA: hypothetical protein DEH78_28135 [Solibacterales bacterium]|nr:hypothetical protein [Bryobacterales bacterium]
MCYGFVDTLFGLLLPSASLTVTFMPSLPSSCDRPPRILLVDDHRDGLLARKQVLEELGFAITVASTAAEALDAFVPGSHDLVITDYRMPRMDGLEFIQHLRPRAPSTPVILISGFADPLGLSEENTGADVVIQKNHHELKNLVSAVNRLLKGKPRKPPGSQGGRAAAKRRRM